MFTYSSGNNTLGFSATQVDPILKNYSAYIDSWAYSTRTLPGQVYNPPVNNYYTGNVQFGGYSPGALLSSAFIVKQNNASTELDLMT